LIAVAPIQQKKKPAETIQSVLEAENELKRKQAEARRRQEVVAALGRFITNNGGWLDSHPGERVLRILARPGSDLPDKLFDLNLGQLRSAGTGEKIWGGKILPINIFTLQIAPVK
jgi:hypothetical protein